MSRITSKDLRREIIASDVANKAEDAYRQRQVKRQSYAESLTAFVPILWSFVWIASLALSAPHTIALFDLISQDLSFIMLGVRLDVPVLLAPLAVEVAIGVLAAMREYGIKRGDFLALIIALMVVSIGVNIIGGANTLLNAPLDGFAADWIRISWLVLSFIAGVSISFVSFYAGTILMQFAKGEIKLEANFDDWYGINKYDAIRIALYEAALALGAGSATADKYARETAYRFCKRELILSEDGKIKNAPRVNQEPVNAVGSASAHAPTTAATASATVATAPTTAATSESREFGFAGMVYSDLSRTVSGKEDSHDKAAVATACDMSSVAAIKTYIVAHRDSLPAFTSAAELCEHLSGNRKKLRNVQRAIKQLKEEGVLS